MASDNRADLRKMKSRIEQLEKATLELNELGGGVPVVEKTREPSWQPPAC